MGERRPVDDIRYFFAKRPWLRNESRLQTVTDEEFQALSRGDRLSESRMRYLRAFIDGYRCAQQRR